MFNTKYCHNNDFFHSSTAATREHLFKLFKEYNRVNARKSFLVNVLLLCGLWNNLPSDIVDFSTLWSFKRTVKVVDLSPFLKCF